MRRRHCISTLPLAFFAFVVIALLAGCGGVSRSSNAPTPTPTPPTVNPPAPGGNPSSSEHLVYALSGNQVFVFDAHPAQGTLQSVGGPIATTLANGAAIAFDAPQRVLFATGFLCMPRGDCGNSMAVLSTSNPKAPSLLNAQSTQDTIALLVDNTGLLPIGLDPVNAFQSWRYDPAAHTFTAVGALQAFQTGDAPSIMLHPSQQVVIGVTSEGGANGPFTTFVNSFHRDPGSGTLTKSATLTLPDEAGFAAMTPDGRFVLVPDLSTGAVNIVSVDGSTGALALAGTSPSAGAFMMYHFIDATHVLGRLKVNNSDRLTMFTFNGTTVTAGATLDLAGSGGLLSVTSVGNTIYMASSSALQMIAFDPATGSLRSIATANTVASSIAVNPVTP
jgi:hypothetical protein